MCDGASFKEGEELFFKPETESLGEKGLSSQESLLVINTKGTIYS